MLICINLYVTIDFPIKKEQNTIIVCTILAVVVYIIFCGVTIFQYNKTHTEYMIEVDDSVDLNNFFDKYEIVSRDGNRYRVKEIENSDEC